MQAEKEENIAIAPDTTAVEPVGAPVIVQVEPDQQQHTEQQESPQHAEPESTPKPSTDLSVEDTVEHREGDDAEAKAEPKAIVEAESNVEGEAKAEPKAIVEAEPNVEGEAKAESNIEAKVEVRVEEEHALHHTTTATTHDASALPVLPSMGSRIRVESQYNEEDDTMTIRILHLDGSSPVEVWNNRAEALKQMIPYLKLIDGTESIVDRIIEKTSVEIPDGDWGGVEMKQYPHYISSRLTVNIESLARMIHMVRLKLASIIMEDFGMTWEQEKANIELDVTESYKKEEEEEQRAIDEQLRLKKLAEKQLKRSGQSHPQQQQQARQSAKAAPTSAPAGSPSDMQAFLQRRLQHIAKGIEKGTIPVQNMPPHAGM